MHTSSEVIRVPSEQSEEKRTFLQLGFALLFAAAFSSASHAYQDWPWVLGMSLILVAIAAYSREVVVDANKRKITSSIWLFDRWIIWSSFRSVDDTSSILIYVRQTGRREIVSHEIVCVSDNQKRMLIRRYYSNLREFCPDAVKLAHTITEVLRIPYVGYKKRPFSLW